MDERPTVDLKHYTEHVATQDDLTGGGILSPDEQALVDALVDYWTRLGSPSAGETE